MKVLYFDVETTGTDPKVNDIVQLSGLIEIDGKIKEKFDFKMRPQDNGLPGFIKNAIVDPEALAINGLTEEEIWNFADPKEVHKEIVKIFAKYIDKYDKSDKFYPAGYNVRFDLVYGILWFY